jgi:hypothetical protein
MAIHTEILWKSESGPLFQEVVKGGGGILVQSMFFNINYIAMCYLDIILFAPTFIEFETRN